MVVLAFSDSLKGVEATGHVQSRFWNLIYLMTRVTRTSRIKSALIFQLVPPAPGSAPGAGEQVEEAAGRGEKEGKI